MFDHQILWGVLVVSMTTRVVVDVTRLRLTFLFRLRLERWQSVAVDDGLVILLASELVDVLLASCQSGFESSVALSKRVLVAECATATMRAAGSDLARASKVVWPVLRQLGTLNVGLEDIAGSAIVQQNEAWRCVLDGELADVTLGLC